MIDSDIDSQIIKALSTEKKKTIMKQLGISPKLPYVIECIEDDKTYTVRDVAELLDISEQHIRRLCRQGKLQSIQINKKGTHKIFGESIKKFIINRINYTSLSKKLFEE